MKRNHKQTFIDAAVFTVAVLLFFMLFRPFGMDQWNDPRYMLRIWGHECLWIYFSLIVSEAITAFLFGLPADYSKDMGYCVRRQIVASLVMMPVATICMGEFWTVVDYGYGHFGYFWHIREDYHFSLYPFFFLFAQVASVTVLAVPFNLLIVRNRMNEYRIRELMTINQELESKSAEPAPSEEPEDLKTITIHGDTKEELEVAPGEILLVESVANYVNVWYFEGGELRQRRLRCTLKGVEEALAEYAYIFHCHRAFLVNIRYITHVEGNAAGCQLQLLGTDKCVPVSKANIPALRSLL